MGAKVSTEYPRPDFQRTATYMRWESLNGPWDFIFDDDDVGLTQAWQRIGLPTPSSAVDSKADSQCKRTIQVPFVFQAPASGIDVRETHEVLWYQREIEDLRTHEERDEGYRVLLRFGAVDYHAKVWLDGMFIGEHTGGHVPFDLDITDAVDIAPSTSHRLSVRVFDSATDLSQPRGKQYWGPKPESIYYTPSSGIWQTVWLEAVPAVRIHASSHGTILRSDDVERGVLHARVAISGRPVRKVYSVEIEVSFASMIVNSERCSMPRDKDYACFDIGMHLSQEQTEALPAMLRFHAPLDSDQHWRHGVALWAPEHPLLYDVKIRLYEENGRLVDEVQTTTGMRSLRWDAGDGSFRLNGRPYFQALILDQGYWPQTLMTPPEGALKHDIELAKSMGFNGCRKHQKVEDPVFLYWADKLGFLVWGEMANCFEFSLQATDRFDQEWLEMVKRDINHPCIITWTPINESWGAQLDDNIQSRNHLRSLYYKTKTLDPSRPINDNCGWEHVITDLSTFHDYSGADGMSGRCQSLHEIVTCGSRRMFLAPIYGKNGIEDEGSTHRPGAPVMCTEFGGVNIAKANDGDGAWGYTTAADAQDLLKRIDGIVSRTVESGIVCGIVWTQLTDIEQEQNGLFTYDRQAKLPAADVKAIMERAAQTYFERRQGGQS